MAARRRFQESFDLQTPVQLAATQKWDFVGSGIVTTTGRHGNGVTGTAGATTAQNTLRTRALNPVTPAVGSQGFALKCPTSFPASEWMVWALLDDLGTTQASITIKPDGKLAFYRGAFGGGGTLLGTSATAFVYTSGFAYIQTGYTLSGSDVAEVRSTIPSGSPAVNVTSLLLIPSIGLTSPRTWMRSEFYLTENIILDDYYVNDGDVVAGVVISGDTEVKPILPSGVSLELFYFPWTPNSGSDKVAPVDDATEDDDSTYLYTRWELATIQFQMAAITDDGRTVDEVQVVAIERAVSSAWLPPPILSWRKWDGIFATHLFEVSPSLSTEYRAFTECIKAVGGLGGNDWTIARVNDSRFGVRS